MLEQLQRGRALPGAVQGHVLAAVAHQLAHARRAVHVRDDLEQVVLAGDGGQRLVMVERAVLVAHGAGGHAQVAVVQRADQHVLVDVQRGVGELLGKAPDLAPAGDRRVVVQEHVVRVGAGPALEADGDHLAGFGVVAEAGGIGHADEFHLHHAVAGRLERRGHHGFQQCWVGAVADDEELAVHEAVGAARVDRAGQRHGPGLLADVGQFHGCCSRDSGVLMAARPPGAMSAR